MRLSDKAFGRIMFTIVSVSAFIAYAYALRVGLERTFG